MYFLLWMEPFSRIKSADYPTPYIVYHVYVSDGLFGAGEDK